LVLEGLSFAVRDDSTRFQAVIKGADDIIETCSTVDYAFYLGLQYSLASLLIGFWPTLCSFFLIGLLRDLLMGPLTDFSNLKKREIACRALVNMTISVILYRKNMFSFSALAIVSALRLVTALFGSVFAAVGVIVGHQMCCGAKQALGRDSSDGTGQIFSNTGVIIATSWICGLALLVAL
jgi:hypothetical protein